MKGEDARFAGIAKDPRFKRPGKDKRKVKIDNRFKHMFTAPEFSSVDFLDSRGRKEKQVTKEKLEKFYEMSDDEEEEAEKSSEEENVAPSKPRKIKKSEKLKKPATDLVIPTKTKDSPVPEDSDESEEEEEEEEEDSSDGESTEDEIEDTTVDAWDEVNTCTETTPDSTRRLSICNLNWDRMTATDVFVLVNSCFDTPDKIVKVEIFPSQYGKEQMKKEQEHGPAVSENDTQEYSAEALRRYQIDRLKYYYAIVTCESVAAADLLYREMDGVEYQFSSSILDLRFVPDDMEFEDDPPTSVCTEMPDSATYKPPTFVTTALQNSSVKLTWDETPQSRLQLTTKKFSAGDLENVDFSAYIASSESEEEEDGDGPSLEKYRALLAGAEDGGNEDEVDQEMEITWTGGLEDNNEVVEEAEKNEERKDNATFYEPDAKDDFFATDTVMERPTKKRKKNKKGSKEAELGLTKEQSELALLMESEKDGDKKHFNMKKIRKCKKNDEDDFKIDLEDDRFAVMKTSHHYAIDPSAPEYKETTQTQKLLSAQAVSLSDKNERSNAATSEQTIIEKIKSKTTQMNQKKEKTKLFKTKNKGFIPSAKTTAKEEELVEVPKKKKKKRDQSVKAEDASNRGPIKKKKKVKTS